jgi:hypothetical protein
MRTQVTQSISLIHIYTGVGFDNQRSMMIQLRVYWNIGNGILIR